MAAVTGDTSMQAPPGGTAFGSELADSAVWMVRLRWLAGALIIAIGVAGWLAGVIFEVAWPVLIGAGILAYNALFGCILRPGGKVIDARARTLWVFQIVADVLALTVIVYFCGGVENPLIILYVFPLVCAGILLPPRIGYGVAVLAAVLFGGVGVLQAAVPELYHPLGFSFSGQHYNSWTFVIIEVCVAGAAMFLATFLAGAIAKRVRAARTQEARNHEVLDAIISSMPEGLIFLAPDGAVLTGNIGTADGSLPGEDNELQGASRSASPASSSRRTDGGKVSDAGPVFYPLPPDSPRIQYLTVPQAAKDYVDEVKRASSPLPARTFQMAVPVPPGEPPRHVQARASAVFGRTGAHLGYVIVSQDITEQRQLADSLRARNREILEMSETLRRHQREMAQHEKMVALGTMSAGIAHEIGNPLAGLSAVMQLLKRRITSEEVCHHFQTMEEQIERIANIVRQTLEFCRPAASQFVTADVDDLIEQTVQMVRFSHRARHARIESVPRWGLPNVRIIPQQIQQVLINLLLNALDAVDGVDGQPLVTIERTVEDDRVVVIVEDNGRGMTEDQINRAFEPFYTTKGPGKGTGLGLAICYRLVEVQGGRIKIESAPGEGTTVTVSFPIDDSASDRGLARAPSAAASTRRLDRNDAKNHPHR